NVEHRLARARVRVHDQAVAVLRDPLLRRDRAGRDEQLAEQRGIRRLDVVHRADVTLRDDQNVQRRLRVDIPERQQLIRLVHDLRRTLPTYDATEETVLL